MPGIERLRAECETTASPSPSSPLPIDRSLNQIAVYESRELGAVDVLLMVPQVAQMPPRLPSVGGQNLPEGHFARQGRQTLAGHRLHRHARDLVYNVGLTMPWIILDFGRTLAQIQQPGGGYRRGSYPAQADRTTGAVGRRDSTNAVRPLASDGRAPRQDRLSAGRASKLADQSTTPARSASPTSSASAYKSNRASPRSRRRTDTPTTTSRFRRASAEPCRASVSR